jgi:hypothetical protein
VKFALFSTLLLMPAIVAAAPDEVKAGDYRFVTIDGKSEVRYVASVTSKNGKTVGFGYDGKPIPNLETKLDVVPTSDYLVTMNTLDRRSASTLEIQRVLAKVTIPDSRIGTAQALIVPGELDSRGKPTVKVLQIKEVFGGTYTEFKNEGELAKFISNVRHDLKVDIPLPTLRTMVDSGELQKIIEAYQKHPNYRRPGFLNVDSKLAPQLERDAALAGVFDKIGTAARDGVKSTLVDPVIESTARTAVKAAAAR